MKACHTIFQTEFGYTGIVYTKDPFQLLKIYLPRQTHDMVKNDMMLDFNLQNDHHSEIDIFIHQIKYYFKGNPVPTPWAWLNWNNMTELQVKTLKQTALIPYGAVCSYKKLAQKIGRPKASRFVGSCMAQNPYPIIIPCHRVIRSDGSIGQFGGGITLKKRLLALEKNRSLLANLE
jgi:methylated-DNA-[protein]-cysteine S-methyltransferase